MKTRPYEMRARAESTAATRAGLVRAALDSVMAERTFGVTLAAIADRAGVSVQTALRHFGSREALMDAAFEVAVAEVGAERTPPPDDRRGALAVLIEHYELRGDVVLGALGEEDREPLAKRMNELGRAEHRAWVAGVFGREIAARPAGEREALLDVLVVATDVYAWKLLRRDRGLTVSQVLDRMAAMTGALAPEEEES